MKTWASQNTEIPTFGVCPVCPIIPRGMKCRHLRREFRHCGYDNNSTVNYAHAYVINKYFDRSMNGKKANKIMQFFTDFERFSASVL